MNFMLNFIRDNKSSGGISVDVSEKVKALWDQYKLPKLCLNSSIITAEFGNLGSVIVRGVESFEDEKEFKYQSGNYDYVSIISNYTTKILWTDYSDTEPYNRNGGLYCDGSSFEYLGIPVVENPEYREFYRKSDRPSNITFGVWGYRYNDFYNSIEFGMCIESIKVDEFILKLREIIGKN